MLEKVGVRQRLGAFLLVAGLAVAALQSASADGRAHLFVQAQDLKNGVRRLNDGRSMPYLGLGVFRVPPGEPTYNAVKTALKLGYRHIDTADAYHNEEAVGKAVKDSGIPREKIWITTKLPFGGSGKDYDFTLAALRTSLSKLGMDYVDLYLIHNPFDKDYRLEQWRALMEAQRLGLAKSIGVSDYKVPALQEIVTAKVPPAVLQIEISPWLKEYRAAELALCEKCAPVAAIGVSLVMLLSLASSVAQVWDRRRSLGRHEGGAAWRQAPRRPESSRGGIALGEGRRAVGAAQVVPPGEPRCAEAAKNAMPITVAPSDRSVLRGPTVRRVQALRLPLIAEGTTVRLPHPSRLG